MTKIKRRDIIILMGDFNAKIGKDNKNIKQIMGRYALGERNDNGQRLIELCSNYDPVTGGSLFPHRECESYMDFTEQQN
jgi:hypothetical protein